MWAKRRAEQQKTYAREKAIKDAEIEKVRYIHVYTSDWFMDPFAERNKQYSFIVYTCCIAGRVCWSWLPIWRFILTNQQDGHES